VQATLHSARSTCAVSGPGVHENMNSYPFSPAQFRSFRKQLSDRSLFYMSDRVDVLQPKGTQEQDSDQILVCPKVGGPGAEVTDQPVVFVLGQEVRNGLFDFGIWKLFGNISGLPMQGDKVVKLPESPYSGFACMHGWIVEFRRECCQL
jgi:hypothetical protein